jgi:hypothetical protein
MSYTVSIAPEGELVGVVVQGELTLDEVAALVTEARALSDKTGFPILYDMSGAVPGEVTKSDLFWMPRKLGVLSSPWARRVRVALVHPATHAEDAQFWENSFRNLGLDVKAFTERAEAVRWVR